MPPALDIYVLTGRRELAVIERFLDYFVDRPRSEDRGAEEISILSLHGDANPASWDSWEWEPALTLTHMINRGLDYPRRAFTIYLKTRVRELDRAILAFTRDDQVVFGISIDDEGARPENGRRARELLDQLACQFEASMGLIMVEQAPPLSELEFRASVHEPLTVYFWERDGTEIIRKSGWQAF